MGYRDDPGGAGQLASMWRFRHLIVLLSIAAVAYYFSFMFQADWKILAVLGGLFAVIYLAASMADPIRPERPPEPPDEERNPAPAERPGSP